MKNTASQVKKENKKKRYIKKQWWLVTYRGANKSEVALRVFSNILVALLIISFATKINAQDIHFSLYNESGPIINPALTGLNKGDTRVGTNFKNQWSSLGTPYKTFAIAFDKRIQLKSNSSLGVGIHAFRDVAGSTRFSTTDLALNLAGIINLNKQQLISVGISSGIIQKSIDPSTFMFPDQYQIDSYNSANPSGEVFDTESALAFNATAGISWEYFSKSRSMVSNDQFRAKAGFAYHHANRPKTNFLENGNQQINPKWVMHSSLFLGIHNTKLALLPSAFFAMQGPAKEVVAGSLLRILLKPESKYTKLSKKMACSLGMYYRVGDAVIPTILIELSNFRVGAAYDITVSSLGKANLNRGGMEFSLTYITPNPFLTKKGNSIKRTLL